MIEYPIRIYADTSLYGGVFDEKFKEPSKRFFDLVIQGKFMLATSPLVEDELVKAPVKVRNYFKKIRAFTEILDINNETLNLRRAYLDAGILTEKSMADALHVALATVAECKMIISWNFRHIVNFAKIPLYNAINVLYGYGSIAIYSPLEVISDEQQEI